MEGEDLMASNPCEKHTLEPEGKPLHCENPQCKCIWRQCLVCTSAIVEIDCPDPKHRETLEREARKLQKKRLQ